MKKGDKTIVSNLWFDNCGDPIYLMDNGWALVEHNKKYNFINDSGEFLSNQWFD